MEALYNEPAGAQAPCHIYWTIDMSGWASLKPSLMKLLDVGALNSTYGWSEQFIDDIVPHRRREVRAMAAMFGLPE